ncbi:MAG: glycoside hydrolase family 127 protein [Oscillospiraceae bacterium]|nr:glycoside hydrolase family 127 protein [Oscillospiraceae bacterium]
MIQHFKLTEGLIPHYARLLCDTVIPFQEDVLNDRVEGVAPSHAIDNFRNAADLLRTGEKTGEFFGMVFQDSDVAKWIEAAAYSLLIKPDAELESRIDELCDLIAGAQEADGYLDTYYTLTDPERKVTNLLEGHELYCAGHMMEASVALYEATGNRKLLSVMEKNADFWYRHFITGGAEGYPGHPEVELALMRLWRATGNDRYKELAEHFINVRGVDPDFYIKEREKRSWNIWGNDPTNREYQQNHLPVREQPDAVGHAVRAAYLYTAMADIAAVTKEPELTEACFRLFESISKRRMYITGGIGSTAHCEAFSTDYDLPNDTVYAETCASIALIFFASKMLKLKRDGHFADVMERAFYNTVLAGIELDGTKFFYVNPLEVIPGSSGVICTHRHDLPQRPGWFPCACCPPNAARLLTSVSKYLWDQEDGVLYSNMFAAGKLTLSDVEIEVETAYPFGDTVRYKVLSGGTRLAVHIPAFTRKNYTVSMPGEYKDGYYYLNVREGDVLELKLDMTPKMNRANIRVARDSGLGAVTVGPIVYCAEGADNGGEVFSFSADASSLRLNCETAAEIGGFACAAADDLGKVFTVSVKGTRLVPDDPDALYFTDEYREEESELKLIPYFMWGNRGINQMRIWLPLK